MNIRNRIAQFLWTLVAQIKCSQGNILLGRVSGAGAAQELTIGAGLTITGTTLSVSGVGSGGNAETVTSIGNLTGVITSNNRVTSIADGALSIAKVAGLQDALDASGGGASDVGDLTTAGLTTANMLRVAAGGGLEQRTPTQVRDDVVPTIIRSAAQGSTSIPSSLNLVGLGGLLSLPTPDPVVTRQGSNLNGKAQWSNYVAGVYLQVFHDGTDWAVEADAVSQSNITSNASSPVGLAGWTSGAWNPVITGSGLQGVFPGQKCRIGDSSPYDWEQWDGTAWIPNAFIDIGSTAPVNQVEASATINPAGADNSVLYTAAGLGAAGNSVTVEYVTPAVQASTTVAVSVSAITVTPGTKARMIVTGTLGSTAYPTLPAIPTLLYAGIDEAHGAVYSEDGTLGTDPEGFNPTGADQSIYRGPSYWLLQIRDGVWQGTNTTHPDQAIWTPLSGGATGTPTITASISSAAQVIAAVNSSPPAAGLLAAAASGTVTGAVAAAATTALTGGVSGTLAPPYLHTAGGLLYVQEDGVWKSAPLSAI